VINRVEMTKSAYKEANKAPPQVKRKLAVWINSVEAIGLEATRRLPGYHDELLQGKRLGQRSMRLNLQWRAIYRLKKDGSIEFIEIEEVIPHAYKP
jgi:proteic killer suppression protein